MDVWLDWEENVEERFSFEDSDRFEEDSLCSWISEPESICGNWRGWKRSNSCSLNGAVNFADSFDEGSVESLSEQCSRRIAKNIPFETVERLYPQIPVELQLRIAFWSFPDSEEDVRLYSCLANGSPDEFQKGEHLLKVKAVKDALQIGFHLSSTVVQPHGVCQSKGSYSVAITFDRGHITSCTCTCAPSATWCSHVVALSLFRIHLPHLVCLRAPVSESLSRLQRDQLQKFAQYLISELPQQILPTAQRLLDELLSSQESAINTVSGAPDPTAGPCATDQCTWCLDDAGLHENIRKMLVKFCGPGPLVFGDVNAMYYASAAPPIAAEWSSLMRALKGHEPEGMWNLLSIVRELFHRRDTNAYCLLEILTDACLAHDQVVLWWFQSSSQSFGHASSHSSHGYSARNNNNAVTTEATKHACASFCDELVVLWRLAVLNPKLSARDRQEIRLKLNKWHEKAVDRAMAGHTGSSASRSSAVACFPGFEPAIDSCALDWSKNHFLWEAELNEDTPETIRLFETTAGSSGVSSSAGSTSSNETCQEPVQEDEVFTETNEVELVPVDPSLPVQEVSEDIEVLCSRAEALHVHGYTHQASKLAVQLGERILLNQCNAEQFSENSTQSNMHYYTSNTLVKTAFLCGVLAEDPLCQHLAFRVGMFGLEMPRQPARNKALEVKLANQESDLASLLKKLPLGPKEWLFVCEKAELLSQGSICRGDSVLPLMLASFLFDTLCCPEQGSSSPEHGLCNRKEVKKKTVDTQNEELGFKAALAALGTKASVSEVEHPMLCEGTRRQRGDLALSMLLYCKDNPTRLRQVMRKFLDKGRYTTTSHKERKKTLVERETKEEPSNKETKPVKEIPTDTRQRGRGVPSKKGGRNRDGSSTSSPDSSSFSDSSQGSSNNSSRRGQGKSNRQPNKLAVTVTEVNHGNESGSSSGVDADVGLSGTAGSDNNDSFEPTVTSNKIITIHVQEVKMVTGPVHAPHVVTMSRPGRVNFTFPETTQRNSDMTVSSPTQQLSSQIEVLNIGGFDSSSNAPSSDSDYCGPEPSLSSGPETAPVPCVSDEGPSRPDSPTSDAIEIEESGIVMMSPGKSTGDTSGTSNARLGGVSTDHNAVQSDVVIPFVGSISLVPNLPSYTTMVIPAMATSNATLSTFGSDCSSGKGSKLPCPSEEWGAGDAVLDKVWCGDAQSNNQGMAIDQEGAHWEADQGEDHIDGAGGWGDQIAQPGNWDCGSADLQWAGDSIMVERRPAEPSAEGHEGDGEASATEEGGRRRGPRGRRGGHGRARKKKDLRSDSNHATEAEAHYMFELAKTVLSKAGGNVNTSLFTQPSTSSHQVGPHRALHMCAFEIGLFALGLHNRYSPNWLSRTYSSHVSWISGQAMEIGTTAIKLLLQQWEGNLTPSEAAGIADRASKSNDPAMVRAATELALSSLHMAHTLNPGEIDRAVEQCHNEDLQLLEKACVAVEKAAYGGGVYPEKLFDVAKEWYYIYEKTQSKSSKRSQPSNSNNSSPSSPPFSPSYPFPYPSLPIPYTTPEQYVQQQMHQQVQHLLVQRQSTQRSQFPASYPFQCTRPSTTQFPLFFPSYQHGYNPVPVIHANRGASQVVSQVSYHLHSAYRVGMLALDSLTRRNPDDRPAVRFARNPHCCDRIRWLCTLSAKLGPQYLQRFCLTALNAVQSPYVLHDLAMDAARHMARGNPTQIGAQLRSPAISPLVQKAMTNYAQCVHHQLFELKQAEYDDFIDMLKHAQGAFLMAPGGMTSFNELLQNIRRGHPKKKELWQKIITEMTRV